MRSRLSPSAAGRCRCAIVRTACPRSASRSAPATHSSAARLPSSAVRVQASATGAVAGATVSWTSRRVAETGVATMNEAPARVPAGTLIVTDAAGPGSTQVTVTAVSTGTSRTLART